MSTNTYHKIANQLATSSFPYERYEHEPIVTVAQAQELAPSLSGFLLKTVVFRLKHGDWILTAVRGPDRIHYKHLADALGVKRATLRSVAPEEVEAQLGFQVGGVGPFPVQAGVQVWFDQRVTMLPRVCFGSGLNTVTFAMNTSDLLTLVHGRVADIIRLSPAP
jgi:Cys-tRNA(Pro)/Cys-tRNA(Cys) deacylase